MKGYDLSSCSVGLLIEEGGIWFSHTFVWEPVWIKEVLFRQPYASICRTDFDVFNHHSSPATRISLKKALLTFLSCLVFPRGERCLVGVGFVYFQAELYEKISRHIEQFQFCEILLNWNIFLQLNMVSNHGFGCIEIISFKRNMLRELSFLMILFNSVNCIWSWTRMYIK